MQKLLAVLVAMMGAGCTPHDEALPSASTPTQVLTAERDCLWIVKSEIGNLLDQRSPIFQKSLASCNAESGHYNDDYVACVQESPYTDTLACVYKARGIDRPERDLLRKNAKMGEYGHYSASIKEVLAAVHKDVDPRHSIDKGTLKLYLERRDKFRENARLPRIDDSHVPVNVAKSSFEQDDRKYWVVRQTYQELQLAKIMRETEHGAESVVCARYGPLDEKLRLNSGLCANLLTKHFKMTAPGA